MNHYNTITKYNKYSEKLIQHYYKDFAFKDEIVEYTEQNVLFLKQLYIFYFEIYFLSGLCPKEMLSDFDVTI